MCFTSDYLVRGTGSEGITGYFCWVFCYLHLQRALGKENLKLSDLNLPLGGRYEVLSGLEEEGDLMS